MKTLSVTFVNVGYGEAILIECPDPKARNGTYTMLIDGGSGEAAEYAGNTSGRIPLVNYLRRRGVSHIDLLVSTHIHEDHLCGLMPVTVGISPAEYWQTMPTAFYREMKPIDEREATTPSMEKFIRSINDYRSLCERVEAAGGRIRCMERGVPSMELTSGLLCHILAPGTNNQLQYDGLRTLNTAKTVEERRRLLEWLDVRMNNCSLILMLEFGGRRILLPGDTNRAGYEELGGMDLHADIFKVGHHGQRDGADEELIARVKPSYVVCCASSDRRYESAHPGLLAMCEEKGAALYFSDCPSYREPLAPHHALCFEIDEDGTIRAAYRNL